MPIKKLPGGRNRKADKLVFSGVKIEHPPNDVFLFVRRVRSSYSVGNTCRKELGSFCSYMRASIQNWDCRSDQEHPHKSGRGMTK